LNADNGEPPVPIEPTLSLLKEYCLCNAKDGNDYLLYADVLFACGDYNLALRYYLNYFLKETDYWRDMEKLSVLLTRHLKRLIQVCIRSNRNLSAAVLFQFQNPVPYSKIFQLLKPAIQGLAGTIKKPYYDPPWQLQSSPIYAFVDINVIEYVGSQLGNDQNAIDFLERRVKKSMYIPGIGGDLEEGFRMRVLVWYLRKLCTLVVG
jgi:hypothetical protein